MLVLCSSLGLDIPAGERGIKCVGNHRWERAAASLKEPLLKEGTRIQKLGINGDMLSGYFFSFRRFESWNFLLPSGQANKVKLTWPNWGAYLLTIYCTNGELSWCWVHVLTLSRKYTMQQRELASLVLLNGTSFPEGWVCKAPATVHPLVLTSRATPVAGGYNCMRSTVGFYSLFQARCTFPFSM